MTLAGLHSNEKGLAVFEEEEDVIAGPDNVGQTRDSEEWGAMPSGRELRVQ